MKHTYSPESWEKCCLLDYLNNNSFFLTENTQLHWPLGPTNWIPHLYFVDQRLC